MYSFLESLNVGDMLMRKQIFFKNKKKCGLPNELVAIDNFSLNLYM